MQLNKYFVIIFLSFFVTGCNAVNPYPIVDDADLGMDGVSQPGSSTAAQGAQQIAGQQTQQRPPQQQPQQQAQQAPQQPQQPPVQEPEVEDADFPKKENIPSRSKMKVNTSKGEVVINLFPNEAPETINNYIDKSSDGFYDGLTFHRVEDWVVQGGDPDGNGTGGGTIPTELSSRSFKEGSVGVARGADIKVSNDSQFFICVQDCSWLTGKYTLFGEVEEGLDIAKQIEKGDQIVSVVLE